MKTACLLLALLSAVVYAPQTRAQAYLNCGFVPGWEQAGKQRQYAADNLFEYKDGGAEGYLQYGFTRMQGVDCKSGESVLTIDVSEMGDADMAYGMFAANRDADQPIAKLGMGGQLLPQSLSFAKGRYYVELTESDGNPDGNLLAALQAFAAKMLPLLEGRDTPPETLSWFPPENLASTKFVPESVLGLRALKRGYIAKYKQEQAFIVLEDSPESAAEVLKQLRARFGDTAPAVIADEGFQAKVQYLDGICIFRKGRYVAGYANAADAQQAAVLARQLAGRIP